MRSRQYRLVACTLLVVFALSATPSFAARRGTDPGDGFFDRIVKVVKHLVFGTTDELSIPKP